MHTNTISSLRLCWLTLFVLGMSAVAVAESGQSLFEALIANVRSIENFDIQVEHWKNFSAVTEGDRIDRPEVEFSIHFRLIADLKKQKCLFVENTRETGSPVDAASKSVTVLKSRWMFRFYDAGVGIIRSLDNGEKLDHPRKAKFAEFCSSASIPAAHSFGFLPPMISLSSLDRFLERRLKEYEYSKVTILPDGTPLLQRTEQRNEVNYQWQITFNPKTLLPTKETFVSEENGKSHVLFEQSANFQLIGTTNCPIAISYSQDVPRRILDADGKESEKSSSQVGSIEVKWHQVNSENLEFPNLDSLGYDLKLWMEFVGMPTTNAKSE